MPICMIKRNHSSLLLGQSEELFLKNHVGARAECLAKRGENLAKIYFRYVFPSSLSLSLSLSLCLCLSLRDERVCPSVY